MKLSNDELIRLAITIVLFAITIGTILWKMSANNTSTKAEIEANNDKIKVVVDHVQRVEHDSKARDEQQDSIINRIDIRTTNADSARHAAGVA